MRYALTACACIVMAAATAAPVAAHHSFAVFFDDTKNIEVTGTVTDFKFSNPHAIISMDVKAKDGTVQAWKAETNAVTLLRRRGWTQNSLKPGEVITVEGWPSRDGGNYMRMRRIVKADGTVLGTPVQNQRVD